MYVSMYACMYVYMYARVYVCMYIRIMYECMYVAPFLQYHYKYTEIPSQIFV